MKRRLLIVGYNQLLTQDVKRKCLSDGLYPYCAENMRTATEELDGCFGYSLVMIFGAVNIMEAVRRVRRISNVPILVVQKMI